MKEKIWISFITIGMSFVAGIGYQKSDYWLMISALMMAVGCIGEYMTDERKQNEN